MHAPLQPPVRPRMLSHASQVRALRACGVRRPPRPRALAALARSHQQPQSHPDIQEVLLTEQQIAARVKEVGRCARAGPQPQPCLSHAARRCTGQSRVAQGVGSPAWPDGGGMRVSHRRSLPPPSSTCPAPLAGRSQPTMLAAGP